MAIIRNFRLPEGIGVSADYIETFGVIQSTSPNTGAVVSRGGVGVGNSISIGGRLQLFNGNYFAAFDFAGSASTVYVLPSSSPATGSSVLQSTSAGVMSWVPMTAISGAASGFTTLNTLTSGIQFFATGTSGNVFNISSSGSTHTFNIPIAGSGSTGLITTLAQTIAGAKTFSSALNISDTTASTSTSNGALQVAGGVGISGRLNFNQASFGTTGIATNPTMAMIGNTGDPIYMTVLEDNSISFEGTQGQLFSITPNLSTGYIYSVNDITGIPLIRANANANVTANEYAGNFGIGLTNPGYRLHVLGSVGFTSTTSSTSTTTGTLIVGGGVGIGGSLYVASATAISGVTINNGVIVGSLTGTATTATYSYQSGYGITAGLATTSTYSHQSGYGITAGLATTSTYSHQSGYGITAGLATTAQTLNTVAASTNATHYVLFSPVNGGSGVAVSSDSGLTFNPSSNTVSLSTLAATTVSTSTVSVTGSTASTSPTTGALVVTGGVGIGGSLYVAGDLTINGTTTTINSVTLTVDDKNIELGSVSTPSDVTAEGGGITLKGATDKSINWYTGTGWSSSESWNLASGSTYKINNSTVLSNSSLGTGVTNSSLTAVGTISTGVWSGTLITALYGGTGYNSFTKGDLLVGAGNTFVKFPVGNDLTILTASSSAGSGLSWKSLLSPTYGAFGSTASQQVTAANTETLVTFNHTYEANNVSIGSGSTTRIYINDSGVFNVQFSSQVDLADGTQPKQFDLWFKINGVNVPISNSRQTIQGKDEEVILSLNFVSTFISGQYIELAYSSPDPNIQLMAVSGNTSPTRPDIPSIILTVTPVSSILPGSGLAITGLASLNLLTSNAQTIVTGTSGSDFNISSIGSVHTFNIPDASTTARGLLSTGSQTLLGSKTFASGVAITSTTASTSTSTGALVITGGVGIGGSIFGGSTISTEDNIVIKSAKEIRLNNSGNTFYTSFKAGSNTANAVYTLPIGYPGAGTSVLQSDTSGNLSWVASSTGTTASSISVNSGSVNSAHSLLFTPTSSSSGSAVSSDSTLYLNPSTKILNVSGLAVTASTASTSTTTGALIVSGGAGFAGTINVSGTAKIFSSTASTNVWTGALTVGGGVGISGQLTFAQASLGYTGITTNPSMSFIGATTSSPITLTVLTDNSLAFEGSSGSLFSIDNNLSSGDIFSVSDISGLPIISASAGQTVNINEFGGYTQIGNGSINSTSTTTGSLVVAGGLGITGNANIGGTARITNTTASTSSTSGALTVSGGAGIAQSLFVGGSISNANYFYSGGNNFTKSGQAQGDVILDNNSNDTPGVLYYYKNNTNFGTDVYATGTGSTRFRIVKDLNESGGAELWSIDRTGVVTQTAWAPGEIIKTTVLVGSDLTGSNPTTINSTSDTDVASYSYTPVSSSSYILIEFQTRYTIAGAAEDNFISRIAVDGAEQTYGQQYWINGAGGGTRSGVLFPLMARYTNSNTTAKTISVTVRRGVSDDNATVQKDSTTVMKITEIGR